MSRTSVVTPISSSSGWPKRSRRLETPRDASSAVSRNFRYLAASSGLKSGGSVSAISVGDSASSLAARAASDSPAGSRAAAASHQ